MIYKIYSVRDIYLFHLILGNIINFIKKLYLVYFSILIQSIFCSNHFHFTARYVIADVSVPLSISNIVMNMSRYVK